MNTMFKKTYLRKIMLEPVDLMTLLLFSSPMQFLRASYISLPNLPKIAVFFENNFFEHTVNLVMDQMSLFKFGSASVRLKHFISDLSTYTENSCDC